jgi:phosphotriesterase-related protein
MDDRSIGKVITVRGLVEPEALGRVMMHEHLHADVFDWEAGELVREERPMTPERRELLQREALPYLARCPEHDCCGFVEASTAPGRAWPTWYAEASEQTGVHLVLCTGFYREVEVGTYWVKTPEAAIWPVVRESSIEELAGWCIGEITEGVQGTEVRAGAIKLGSSEPEMTAAEEKAFRAGARAQRETGVHITTHCTGFGVETSQLRVLQEEGVDLNRVVIGHTAPHLMDPEMRWTVLEWMRRGANFMPTNLRVDQGAEAWRPLIEAIHEVFEAGLGEHLVIGTDWAFVSESGPFGPCSFMPPPPFLQLFTQVLPAFRELGLAEAEEDWMMLVNPQRLLAVSRS